MKENGVKNSSWKNSKREMDYEVSEEGENLQERLDKRMLVKGNKADEEILEYRNEKTVSCTKEETGSRGVKKRKI